jgi:subtilisin family serine protease
VLDSILQYNDPHGTPVAGIVGGSTYGVAPQVRLISVRSGPCEPGSHIDELLAGAEWIAEHFVTPAVVNLSAGLGSTVSESDKAMLDDAIAAIVDSGVPVIVAAGNDGADACNVSPARISETITVGATTDDDERWQEGTNETSGYGQCVDLFAPGHGIVTAFPEGDPPDPSGTSVESGTSFATPHVTGVVARYLAANPTATPAQVRSYILDMATEGVLANIGTGSPNLLAFTPRVLSSGFNGPTSIPEAGDYDWFAEAEGGDYDYDYAWAYRNLNGGWYGSWTSLGTDTVATRSIDHHDGPFHLRLIVSSGVQVDTTVSDSIPTFCEPNCPQFHDPPGDTLLQLPLGIDR